MFLVGDGSGGPYVTGWVLALFPYLDKLVPNHYVFTETWRAASSEKYFSGVSTSFFIYHMNQIPFKWNYFKREISMLFIGGLVGVVYEYDNSLRPIFGYAITENKTVTSVRFRD